MGVMSCQRKDCDNIMCHTYEQSVGYICYECQSEFKDYLKKNNLNPQTEGEIKQELKKFMNIPKDYYTEGKHVSIDQFFSERTK